ncbi:MAG: adenine-specific DNA-methyltransferase [Victivallaceae bacterium]
MMSTQYLFDFDSQETLPQHRDYFELPQFDFHTLFSEKRALIEVHNDNSMVINGDCLDILQSMKSKTINLIFADAPYNIGKDFGNNTDKWDSVASYIQWCKKWIDECLRVLTDDGTMYIMTATQHMPYLDVYISEHYNVLCRIVWAYDSSGVQSKKIYGSLYEPILMINKSPKAPYVFNYQDILVEAKTGAQRKLIDYRKDPPQPYNSEKVPGNVWDFSRVRFRMDEYENHPTQKPEALLERIIRASSNPGDIVLDPFAGSFTTSTVAVKLGRVGLGIELNSDFFEIGIRRTGIANEYCGKTLEKQKVKKTNAKSKYNRGAEL